MLIDTNIKKIIGLIVIIMVCGVVNAAQANLLAHKWYLGILNQEALRMADFAEQKPYLELKHGGTFSAFLGCNQIVGNFTLTGPHSIHFSVNNHGVSSVVCEQKLQDLETKFVTALQTVKVWEITNDVLYLKDNLNDRISIAIFMPHEPY